MLAGCAAGVNSMSNVSNDAGFLMGLWHGIISMFTFFISLFNENVRIYEVENTGRWYDFGFIIGVMMFYGGGSASANSY